MCLRRCAASCLSFFSTIYPAFLCRTSRFDALGIKDRIAWLRFAPGFLPGCFDQMLQDLLPQPAQTCAPAEAVYGRAGRKIVRQMPPLAPCFYEVQHRVCQFPLAPLVRSHPGIEWFYHCPLCICQVARVRLPHFIASFHVFILLLESAFVNTGSQLGHRLSKMNFPFCTEIKRRSFLSLFTRKKRAPLIFCRKPLRYAGSAKSLTVILFTAVCPPHPAGTNILRKREML